MFYVYVLKSKSANVSFVGFTTDVEKKLEEHNSGKNSFTKENMPWVVIYKEAYKTATDARKREIYLKGAAGRTFLKNIWEIV